MKTRILKAGYLLALISLFSLFLYSYLAIPLWDYDFWWHMANGRYIVENQAVPDNDPFSYTSDLAENKNLFPRYQAVVLKQYWLAQVIFYLIYKTFGDAGMIFLRSILLTLALLFVYMGLKRDRIRLYVIFPLLFMAYFSLQSHIGERPVLFTVLFSVPCYLLLDNFRRTRGRSLLLLIPLMLLWANLHGGFIIGAAVIVTFILGETVDLLFKRVVYSKKDLRFFYQTTIIALAATLINPNGLDPLVVALTDLRFFTKDIQEYQQIFVLYWYKTQPVDPEYIGLLFLSLIVFFARGRKMPLTSVLLLIGLTAMSLSAVRFMGYYTLIGTLIVWPEIDHILTGLFNRRISRRAQDAMAVIFVVLMLVSFTGYFVMSGKFEMIKFGKASGKSVPVAAVDFIENNRIEGNLFNDFGFGGYVVWRLYPWKKNFIDTRSLNSIIIQEYTWIIDAAESSKGKKLIEGKAPLWQRLLEHYQVEIILLDSLRAGGDLPPILLKLLDDETWKPVFVDIISVVFVKNKDENRELISRYGISKEFVYDAIMARATQNAMVTGSPTHLIAIGDLFYKRGMMKESVTAYEYAVKRLPRSHSLRRRLEEIKKEFEKK
ncbi:MAG: hypothetical protein HZA17_10815 [Nitrospirae bacterium]|nr:hypothetical protein [Nitrospirota bacterium]